MSLSVLEIGAYVSAGLVAASRLLDVAKPLWEKLPRPVAVAIPVVVAALPALAEQAGLVHTEIDLVTLCITALSLIVPGITEVEKSV
jgi:hypothetical protein